MNRDIPDSSRREYERRLNMVFDHVRTHPADDLDLETLAGVACFSPWHFHRIFTALTGDYGQMEEEVWNRLFAWAGPRGVLGPQTAMLGVCHDDPEVTPAGKYGVNRVEGTNADIGPAWRAMFGEWLPSSGWQCDDRPTFERYHGKPDPATGRMTFEIWIPVKPL